jgi:hypothetical protein
MDARSTLEGMVPTPRAEALAQPLRNALSETQLELEARCLRPRSCRPALRAGPQHFLPLE